MKNGLYKYTATIANCNMIIKGLVLSDSYDGTEVGALKIKIMMTH